MATYIDVAQHPLDSLLIHSSKTSGQIANLIDHTGADPYPNAHIGCDVFKTKSIYTGATATFDSFIRGKIEPNVRFYRFMSLIRRVANNYDGTVDDADRSALSAVIDNLKLGTTDWTADKVQHAYSVQYQNIPDLRISNIRSSTIGSNADYAHIYHTVPTH